MYKMLWYLHITFLSLTGISETSFITTESGEVQQISPEVINQILSSMERQDQMASSVVSDVPRSQDSITVSTNTKTGRKNLYTSFLQFEPYYCM